MSFYFSKNANEVPNNIVVCNKKEKRIGIFPILLQKKYNDTLQVQDMTYKKNKRTYTSTLYSEKGSMTVEMAVSFPIFLFVMFTMLLFSQMVLVDQEIYRGVVECARQLSEENYPTQTIIFAKHIWSKKVDQDMINQSFVEDGVSGISLFGSYYDEQSGHIILKVRYTMKIPIPLFYNFTYNGNYEYHQKAFRGYRSDLEGQEEEYVYVTETQSVYHNKRGCSYLSLKIQQVYQVEQYLLGETSYLPCELCMKQSKDKPSILYTTSEGNKYHSTLQCSGLKRTVKRVKRLEVGGLCACSRCGKE